jgi:hypothetical protein
VSAVDAKQRRLGLIDQAEFELARDSTFDELRNARRRGLVRPSVFSRSSTLLSVFGFAR